MQWLMLQQDHPEGYVIATGQQHSVRDFVQQAAGEIGIEIRWEGSGVDEKGYPIAPSDPDAAWGGAGEEHRIVAVDPRYFRPTEVETLLGDAGKARRQLGWEPEISFPAAGRRDDARRTQGGGARRPGPGRRLSAF